MFLFVICLTMTDRRKFPIHLCHTHTHTPFTEQFISFRLIQKQMLRFFFTFNNRTQGLPNLLSLTTKQKKTNWTSNKWNLAREVNSLIFRCFCFIAAKLTTRKVFGLFFYATSFRLLSQNWIFPFSIRLNQKWNKIALNKCELKWPSRTPMTIDSNQIWVAHVNFQA